MLIRWSPDAAADLQNIVEYIDLENPRSAYSVGKSIYDRLGILKRFPYSGRPGRVDGTRELPLPPLPFIVVYRVFDGMGVVEIVSVIHGSQLWPPAR